MTPKIKNRIEQIQKGEVPEGYKKTKIGVSPNDWTILKSKKIFYNVSDKNHNGELEVLSVTQDKGVVPRKDIDIDIKYDKSGLKNYKKVKVGNFVISLRSFQGGIEYSEYEGLVSPAYTVLEATPGINQPFYKYYLKSSAYISHLNIAVYGIRDGKQISYNDFGTIEIPVPLIEEQNKIADILTTQDKLIELKEKLLEEKKKQKKYLMQQLLTGKKRLKDFNDEWSYVRIKDIGMVITGNTPSRKEVEFWGKDFPWVSAQDFTNKYITKTKEYLTKSGKKVAHIIPKDSVLVTCIASIGLNAIAKINCATNQQINSIICYKNISNELIYYLMENNVEYLKKLAGQTAVSIISKSQFEKIKLYIPIDFNEQTAIADILSTADKEIDLLEKDIEAEKQKKKALMQLLLTGIVRVN